MYELLTGKVPFDGDGPGEVFAAVLERTPVSPRVHRPDLSPEWEEIVMRCLRRDPEARFQSAGQLAAAIAPLGSGRWAHLVGGIRKALTQPPTAVPQEAMVLVAAAVAAARASMPPSARATGGLAELGAIAAPPMLRYTGPLAGTAPLPGFSMGVPISAASPAATSLPESGTLSTSIAVADPSVTVAPIAARAAPPRSVRQPIAIAAAVVLSAGALLAAVHALRGPARAHAASVTPGATEGVRPPPSAPAPAASSASSASDEQPPSDAPPATPEPVLPQPSPSAATRAPDPAVSGHAPTRHPTRLPAKRPPADARPKFLKSWN
jgi:serine/threonine-protein kinase